MSGRQRGLSLTELLVALAIAGVIGAIGLPSFVGLYESMRTRSAVNQLIAAVYFARHAAVTHRRPVTLCPSEDRTHCGGTFEHGAIAFIDDNRDGHRQAQDVLLAAFDPLPDGSRASWHAFGNRRYLRFLPTGMTHWQNGHFMYCPPGGDPHLARQVIINVQGRARLAPDRDGDGIVEDARGRPVHCD